VGFVRLGLGHLLNICVKVIIVVYTAFQFFAAVPSTPFVVISLDTIIGIRAVGDG
jgi:hypothetical protein